jgi:hypothetical protein
MNSSIEKAFTRNCGHRFFGHSPLVAQPTLFVHIRKGTFAPVRPPEIRYCRRLGAISLIRRAGPPAHK